MFVDYGIRQFFLTLNLHYEKGGAGAYHGISGWSIEKQIHHYKNNHGRFGFFLKKYSAILSCKDGDSFLDAGCGLGQNIKEIV